MLELRFLAPFQSESNFQHKPLEACHKKAESFPCAKEAGASCVSGTVLVLTWGWLDAQLVGMSTALISHAGSSSHFADWGTWLLNRRIIGRLFWKVSWVPKPELWEYVNILNFFFFAIALQGESLEYLNSSSKWLENIWHEGRFCVTCGREAALALRWWVTKTSNWDAQGCGNIRGLFWQFQA